MSNLKSPFNYTGTKQNTLDFLFDKFNKNASTFIDVFCGGGSVGLTATNFYNTVVMNDVITPLISFYEKLAILPFDEIYTRLEKVKIDKLSQDSFIEARLLFNSTGANDPYLFFALCSACTNNMMRFNKKFEFNQTFGKRTINEKTLEKLTEYHKIIHQNKKLNFVNSDFQEMLKTANPSTMVYLDPPYVQTSAGYNCYWSKDKEKTLYDEIDNLAKKNIPFAMSNTLYHKGELNPNFDRFKHFNIIEVDKFYNKVAKEEKDKQSIEILVTNY